MTKAELVDQVATTVHLSKSQTDAVLTQCLQAIMDALQAGESVALRGFGRFHLRHRQPRAGRTPPHGGVGADSRQSCPHFYRGEGFPGTDATPRRSGGSRVRATPGMTGAYSEGVEQPAPVSRVQWRASLVGDTSPPAVRTTGATACRGLIGVAAPRHAISGPTRGVGPEMVSLRHHRQTVGACTCRVAEEACSLQRHDGWARRHAEAAVTHTPALLVMVLSTSASRREKGEG